MGWLILRDIVLYSVKKMLVLLNTFITSKLTINVKITNVRRLLRKIYTCAKGFEMIFLNKKLILFI